MNIDTFGISQEEKDSQGQDNDNSFVYDEVASIKRKIENRKAKQKRLKVILGSLTAIIVVLILVVIYSQYKLYTLSNEEKMTSDIFQTSTSTPKTGEEILRALRRHIITPEGDPQIAEVQDAPKLKESQAFFKDVQNGDVVIVYTTMIYVYRPSADIVVASDDISGVGEQKP